MVFLTRPENKDKPETPTVIQKCLVCNQETTFRKIVPEDIHAANAKEVDSMFKILYNQLNKIEE